MSPETFTCTQEGCPAPEGGPCLAGHADPDDCPNITVPEQGEAAPESENADVAPDVERPPEPEGRRLSAGVALTLDEANGVAGQDGARIVMPVGSREVGKTTLIVELYERFLDGRVGEVQYALSRTLLDFELIAFAARLDSGADIPATWRTRLADSARPILHLAVLDGTDRENLMFVNVSGELTDRVRNGKDPDVELPLLGTSDRILICVDGFKVVHSVGSCDREVSKARQLIRVLGESATFVEAAQIALVLTKWDEVHAVDEAVARWEAVEGDLADHVETLGRPSEVFRVAARKIASTPPDDGMAGLLEWFLAANRRAPTPISPPSGPTRAMSRFGNDNG
jgi:hypothetical protein